MAAHYHERDEAETRGEDPEVALATFRTRRDGLFANHLQSALDEQQRRQFRGLAYFPYDPKARIEGTLDAEGEPQPLEIETSGEEAMPMRRTGQIRFDFAGRAASLSVYWIDVYGGGLFLPFWDSTAPSETYGGGRYLFDTIKGSTFRILERDGDRWHVQLDFNYAYNPSCAYNPRWACPLAPPENRLPFSIRAGEKKFVIGSVT